MNVSKSEVPSGLDERVLLDLVLRAVVVLELDLDRVDRQRVEVGVDAHLDVQLWKNGSLRSTSVAWSAHTTGLPSPDVMVVMFGSVPCGTMFHSIAEFSRYVCLERRDMVVSRTSA